MRVAVHDYAGHPFQVQLSRELARRGHEVLHVYCANVVTGQGALVREPDDPSTFAAEGIDLGEEFQRYSPAKRFTQELQYGRQAVARLRAFGPDVVMSANTPLLAQWMLMRGLPRNCAGFVFWVQDIHSIALAGELRKRVPVAGGALGRGSERLERHLLSRADEIVVISDDFRPLLTSWGLPPDRITTIENWAPLDELPRLSPDNAWAREQGLIDKFVFLYSGTLGLKHNPELLARVAREFSNRSDVSVVVISQGLGADYLEQARDEFGLTNLVLLPYQPYARLPEVVASADVVIAILEPEAGVFSVPSKVLTYHCAGRAILAAIPAENLAARIISREQSGLVTDPRDADAFVAAAQKLVDDEHLRVHAGDDARAYAERAFDIVAITDCFEPVLARAARRGHAET